MAFNLNAYRESHRPWSFTVGARTFTGKHVSAPQCQRFDRWLVDAGTSERKRVAALRYILRCAFPWRMSYAIRGDPVRIILHDLEPAARTAALTDFFACLRGTSPTLPQQTTLGTPSSARTPRRTA